MTPVASAGPESLRPLARCAIEREASAVYKRAAQVDVAIEEDRISIHVELDRVPTVIHLGMYATVALADLPAFENEVGRVTRLVLSAMSR